MVGGGLAAVAGYVTLNTQEILAYKGGTLANVHAICQSPLITLGGQTAVQRCSAINGWYTLSNVALWGGVILVVIGLVMFLIQRKPQEPKPETHLLPSAHAPLHKDEPKLPKLV